MNINWITKTGKRYTAYIYEGASRTARNIETPIAEITTFIYVKLNDNSIRDFVNLQSQLLAGLLQQQHGEQDPITGPNVKGVNIGKSIAPGKRMKSVTLFLKPKAAKANTIA